MKMRFNKRNSMNYAKEVAAIPLHDDDDERSKDIWDVIDSRNIEFRIEKGMRFLDENGKSLLASPVTHLALYTFAQLRTDGDCPERIESKRQVFLKERPLRCLVTFELDDGSYLPVLGRGRTLCSQLNEELGNEPFPFVNYVIPASQFNSEDELKEVLFEIAQKSNAPKTKDIDPETQADLMNTLFQGYSLHLSKCARDNIEPLSNKEWSCDFLDEHRPNYSNDTAVRTRLINKAFRNGCGTNIPEADMKLTACDVYESVFGEPWDPENENVTHKTSIGIMGGQQGYSLNILKSSFFNYLAGDSANIAYWMISIGNRSKSGGTTGTKGITSGRKATIKALNDANIIAEAIGLQVVHRVVFMGQTTDVDVEIWEWRNTKKEMVKKF